MATHNGLETAVLGETGAGQQAPGIPALLQPTDTFVRRHLGPDSAGDPEIRQMLGAIGVDSLERLIGETVPESIRLSGRLSLSHLPEDRSLGERETLGILGGIAARNQVFRSFIGMGYYGCLMPAVIQRNILENPGWYTQYTPYQAEIAQGRLEALLNFQTMVADLTGLPLANASLLDEATAAAEAMDMCAGRQARTTLLRRRGLPPADDRGGEDARRGDRHRGARRRSAVDRLRETSSACCSSTRRPTAASSTDPRRRRAAHTRPRRMVVMAADLLALTLLTPPGEFGADIAVGSTQRFGVPMGFGGPHAAFLASRDEHKRQHARPDHRRLQRPPRQARRSAWRCRPASSTSAARRPRATSARRRCCWRSWRACTPSITAPRGCAGSPSRVHALTRCPRRGSAPARPPASATSRSSTRCASTSATASADSILTAAEARRINLRDVRRRHPSASRSTRRPRATDVEDLIAIFAGGEAGSFALDDWSTAAAIGHPGTSCARRPLS